MKILCVIPARYASTRLPGKPLAMIDGKPMIERVYSQVSTAKLIDKIIVATDNILVEQAVKSFGGNVMMTKENHQSGTDRLAEVAEQFSDYDILINVQGDEPLITAEIIDKLAAGMLEEQSLPMATLKTSASGEELHNPAVVKVVTDKNDYALYFSRSLLPYPRNEVTEKPFTKHIGIYAYRRDFLLEFSQMAPTFLEKTESLEQLRALENGHKIKVFLVDYQGFGIDTPEDLVTVNKIWRERKFNN